MAGIRTKPRDGKYQGWYKNAAGRIVFFTGTAKKNETREMAEALEHKHRRIAVGVDDVPTSGELAKTRPIAEVMDEYVAWGNAQGGIRGRPWAPEHAEKREWGLNWWKRELGLETLADVYGILPRVEAALRKLLEEDKASLTIRHRAACLTAFLKWCELRGMVQGEPLRGMVAFPKETRKTRRALTAGEIHRLLATCTPERRLLYEVALSSGLRANELRSLTGADIDTKRGGLVLRAEWTKNRKSGFQPLPGFILARLMEVANVKGTAAPLLTVGEHTARDLRSDFKRAGMSEKGQGPGGVVDFHALRVAYTTFVIESGANVKEAQTLARHSTPDLTMNVYARTRNDRLAEVAEAVGRAALSQEIVVEAVALKTGTDDTQVAADENRISLSPVCPGETVKSVSHAFKSDCKNAMEVRCTPANLKIAYENSLGEGLFSCPNLCFATQTFLPNRMRFCKRSWQRPLSPPREVRSVYCDGACHG